ncbi:MAG TPA: transporter substrate-binding domain-containing protein [Candidatus Sabulitectum sp.]|nr:transporter substrate-binding domain-containing protein [Candidatus Sabulitectum sp.]
MSLSEVLHISWRPAALAGVVLLAVSLAVLFHFPGGTDPFELTVLTPEERAWLNENPDRLTLFYNTDFPPIEFAAEDGSFTGLGADVASEVERRLGIEFIRIPCQDWNRHLQALADGDCAVAPTIVRTDEREEYSYFTVPYASVPVVMIATSSIAEDLALQDLEGLRVAVVSGYATEEYLRNTGLDLDLIPMWNVQQALRSVAFGEADVLVENLAVASYYAGTEGLSNLRVAGVTDYYFDWSIGVSREYPLLYSSIQKAMADISRSRLEELYGTWITMTPRGEISAALMRKLRPVGLFLAVLLLSLAIITIYLRQRLNQKVKTLENAQRELLEQTARLQHAEKMEALGNLAGGIAHDFNNILQVIVGYAQLLLEKNGFPPEERRSLEHIAGAGRRASTLIGQLMAFGRHMEFRKVPVDLNREVSNAVEVLGQTIPKMIRITTDLERDLPPVLADPVHIEQVIFNLAGNAVDAMPEGGELEVRTWGVEISETECGETGTILTGRYAVLMVSDTGSGIPPEVRKSMYDPFYTTKEPGKGTGLGLASVYGIVRSLGGCIRCESAEGSGTVFTILLPVAEGAEVRLEAPAGMGSTPSGKGETVLVVDDEPDITSQSREYLTHIGYHVLTASTGEEALERIELEEVDLVILDLNMPGMGGFRCLEEIRKKRPALKVLIASGHSEFDVNLEELMKEASGFLRKPYRLSDLAERAREVLDNDG